MAYVRPSCVCGNKVYQRIWAAAVGIILALNPAPLHGMRRWWKERCMPRKGAGFEASIILTSGKNQQTDTFITAPFLAFGAGVFKVSDCFSYCEKKH